MFFLVVGFISLSVALVGVSVVIGWFILVGLAADSSVFIGALSCIISLVIVFVIFIVFKFSFGSFSGK